MKSKVDRQSGKVMVKMSEIPTRSEFSRAFVGHDLYSRDPLTNPYSKEVNCVVVAVNDVNGLFWPWLGQTSEFLPGQFIFQSSRKVCCNRSGTGRKKGIG
jgi:hypothetical protein